MWVYEVDTWLPETQQVTRHPQGVSKKDMQSLTAAVGQPREHAIRHGLSIQGRRYEVRPQDDRLQTHVACQWQHSIICTNILALQGGVVH